MAKRRNRPSSVDPASQLDPAPPICAKEVLLRNGGKILLESTDPASEPNLEAERAQVAPYLARVGAWFEAEFGQLELRCGSRTCAAHRRRIRDARQQR